MSHKEPTASNTSQALPPAPPLITLLCMQTPIPDLPVFNLLPISSVNPSPEVPSANHYYLVPIIVPQFQLLTVG
jgi:hypothetical protein